MKKSQNRLLMPVAPKWGRAFAATYRPATPQGTDEQKPFPQPVESK
jgi:hypothetical protein